MKFTIHELAGYERYYFLYVGHAEAISRIANVHYETCRSTGIDRELKPFYIPEKDHLILRSNTVVSI